MTSARNKFLTYFSCPGNDKVRIADRFLSPIVGKGSINYTSSIHLPLALHIPQFSHNLLSVITLTRDLNCKIEFFLLIVLYRS